MRSIWLRLSVVACGSFVGAALSGSGCSLDNQEGPIVTCEDLECGRINACAEGIIAQCVDGRHVVYHVCSTEDICGAEWQVAGQFRCAEDITDCEGCRPEREGCSDIPSLGGGGGGPEGGAGGSGFPVGGSPGGGAPEGGAGGSGGG
jgi:hypothetical protein